MKGVLKEMNVEGHLDYYVALGIKNNHKLKQLRFNLEPLGRPFDLAPGESLHIVVGGSKDNSGVDVLYEDDGSISGYFWSITETWIYKDRQLIFWYPGDLKSSPPEYLGDLVERLPKET